MTSFVCVLEAVFTRITNGLHEGDEDRDSGTAPSAPKGVGVPFS